MQLYVNFRPANIVHHTLSPACLFERLDPIELDRAPPPIIVDDACIHGTLEHVESNVFYLGDATWRLLEDEPFFKEGFAPLVEPKMGYAMVCSQRVTQERLLWILEIAFAKYDEALAAKNADLLEEIETLLGSLHDAGGDPKHSGTSMTMHVMQRVRQGLNRRLERDLKWQHRFFDRIIAHEKIWWARGGDEAYANWNEWIDRLRATIEAHPRRQGPIVSADEALRLIGERAALEISSLYADPGSQRQRRAIIASRPLHHRDLFNVAASLIPTL